MVRKVDVIKWVLGSDLALKTYHLVSEVAVIKWYLGRDLALK